MLQTVLGSTGVIGHYLAENLSQYTKEIRLVSRNPSKVNPSDEICVADITDPDQTYKAVEGSSVVYLTIGLPYDTKVWKSTWPVIMKNVIEACIKHQSKLVFFDNVYLYGKVNGWMTEMTPINPSSAKGNVRAEITRMFMDAVDKGKIHGLIARAADFYGPFETPAIVNFTVFERLARGKSAQWLVNSHVKHSFTYTPDAGMATALLGNTANAFDQVWHLPTDHNVLTGKEFIEQAAMAFGVNPNYAVAKKWMLGIMSLFSHTLKESMEMLYQQDSDYLFSSSKFDNSFNFKTTKYAEGIKETSLYYINKIKGS